MSGGETQKIIEKAGSFANLVILISQGDREEQQDIYGYCLDEQSCYVTVCDGYVHGELASRTALEICVNRFKTIGEENEIPYAMRDAVISADTMVSGIRDENGDPIQMGTTAVQVLIRNRNLYWNSVGDSRIYLFRKDQFVQVTTDHTYHTVLNEKYQAGQITKAQMEQEMQYGDKLVNYIGIGNLELTDHNNIPFPLERGDIILLMTDGLYKILDDTQIREVIMRDIPIKERIWELEIRTEKRAAKIGKKRDNMTVALIEMK